MAKPDLKDYVEVPDRIVKFYERFPEGSLRSQLIVDDGKRVVIKALAYRSPEDKHPGTGHAEEVRGDGPVNKTSAVENCETSAWGRAIVSVGILAKGEKVASKEEVEIALAKERDGRTLADLSDKELEDATGGKVLLTDDQRGRLNKACEALGWSSEDLAGFLKSEIDCDDVDDLGKGDAEAVLRLLREKVRAERKTAA